MKKHVHLELLDADFLFVICPHDQISKTLKGMIAEDRVAEFEEKSNTKTLTRQTQGRTVPMSGGGSVIWLRKMDKSVLLHECVHAVSFLLMERGIPHNDDTDEIYAYTLTWLYNKAL